MSMADDDESAVLLLFPPTFDLDDAPVLGASGESATRFFDMKNLSRSFRKSEATLSVSDDAEDSSLDLAIFSFPSPLDASLFLLEDTDCL